MATTKSNKPKKANKCIIKVSSAYWFDEKDYKSVCDLAIKQLEEQFAERSNTSTQTEHLKWHLIRKG